MKVLFVFLLVMTVAVTSFAQVPEKMSYQSIIRDSSDKLVVNKDVDMKISILYGKLQKPVYVETHTASTNANGLVSIKIGTGSVIKGSFSNIDWGNGIYYVEIETDINQDKQYDVTSTSQLLSVPYALYAKTAGNIDGMVDVKSIPINIYGAYLTGGASYEKGAVGNSGIKLPVDGTPSVTFNFTIPSDYVPGDTIFIRMVNSSNNTGRIVLLPNFTSVAQPGSGYNYGGSADSGFTLGDVNIASTTIPVASIGYFISPDTNKELHPGDAVSLGLFRRGGTGDDVNAGYLMIHSIDLRY